MSYYTESQALTEVIEMFVLTPFENPEIVPTILPLVAGAVVIELYFGKHKTEELGWNTSVGNAVIWVSTGATLYMTETLSTPELYATGSLIGLGLLVGYMDFFHKWSETMAFMVSSAGVVYTLAYMLVVLVKTDLSWTQDTLEASAIFFIGTNVVFKIVQMLEVDQRENSYGFNSRV